MDTGVIQPLGRVNHATIQVVLLLGRLVLLALDQLPRAVSLVQQAHTTSVSIIPVSQLVLLVSMQMEAHIPTIFA